MGHQVALAGASVRKELPLTKAGGAAGSGAPGEQADLVLRGSSESGEWRVAGFHAGDVIAGRYQVRSVLGEGGMGIVYLCVDRRSGQHVAVKRVTRPAGANDERQWRWFHNEARALASLCHPHIVAARDFGRLEDGSPYLAMDFVRGSSLHEHSHRRLTFSFIWAVTDQILSALAHAHARGVIHGDLKPSNVIVEQDDPRDPSICILDFGLAWLRQSRQVIWLDDEKATVLRPHTGAGTPGYMAPEQTKQEAHHVCGATDLYSLGCILYRLISGHAPFGGDTDALQRAHAFAKPPSLQPMMRVPRGVDEFVARCLRKQPWERFEYAGEARRAWARLKPAVNGPWRVFHRFALATVQATPSPPAVKLNLEGDSLGLLHPPHARGQVKSNTRRDALSEASERLLTACRQASTARDRQHRSLLLLGQEGAGKSRLVRWLFETIHEDGQMVPLLARYRPGCAPGFGLRGAVLRHYNFEHVDRSTIEASLTARWGINDPGSTERAWIAAVANWLRAEAVSTNEGGESRAAAASAASLVEGEQSVEGHVIRLVLHKLAGGRPLLLILDDLHLATHAECASVLGLHRREADRSIVIVTTMRGGRNHLSNGRWAWLQDAFEAELIDIGADEGRVP